MTTRPTHQPHRHTWEPSDPITQPGRYVCTECPASAAKCTTCTHILETAGRTCDECISQARNTIREIRDAYRMLPDIIAAVAGLHAIRYDRGSGGTKKRSAADTSIIGGAAFVLAGPGGAPDRGLQLGRGETTEAIATLSAAETKDPPSVLGVLTGWEDTWRIEQGQPAADTTSVDDAVKYLILHTSWAAQNSNRWPEYIRTTRALWRRLQGLTGQTNPPVESGVPCPYCSGTIVQWYRDGTSTDPGKRGLDDVRRCDTCGLTWASEAHFMLTIRETHRALPITHPDQLVTLDDAKRILRSSGVRPNLLALWAHRDQRDRERYADGIANGQWVDRPAPRLPEVRGRDARGDATYRLGDLADRCTPATTKSA